MRTGFNPLQIGSTLQKRNEERAKKYAEIVSIPYKSGQHFKNRCDPHTPHPARPPAPVSIPYKSGQHFKTLISETSSSGASRFQSPTNRVNTSKSWTSSTRSTVRIACFNPLQIGSTLQKKSSPLPPSPCCTGFNPLQIGSTLQKLSMSSSIKQSTPCVSIPYKSGQHFKNEGHGSPSRHSIYWFQSPTNRVNTSKRAAGPPRQPRGTGFQSPTNRVNTSNG